MALAGASTVAMLILTACGGGDEGDPGPAQASSSECNSPVQTHFATKFQVSGARIGTMDTEYTYGEKADFNGQAVLQNTERRSFAYTGPSDLAGLSGNEIIVDYFTVDDANEVITAYGSASATVWASAPQRIRTEAFIYSPPMTSRMFQLMPGQSTDLIFSGTRRLEDWDGRVTTDSADHVDHVTYHGQETITVPAGTFTACKFTTTGNSAASQATAYIQWIAKGTGAILKEQSTDEGDSAGSTTVINEAVEIRQF